MKRKQEIVCTESQNKRKGNVER